MSSIRSVSMARMHMCYLTPHKPHTYAIIKINNTVVVVFTFLWNAPFGSTTSVGRQRIDTGWCGEKYKLRNKMK